MPPVITAFERSPDRGRGLARDFRVRWALEELGRPYDVRLVAIEALKTSGHRRLNPFGQIPTLEDGDLVLFESGAIVLRLAESGSGLLPVEADARARAVAWMFAALNTVEPPIVERSLAAMLERDRPWFAERQAMLDERVQARLADLESALGDADWLEGDFSAADLLMATVLRRAAFGGALEPFATLRAYVARAEERPAFQRAFAAQKAAFEASQPA